MSDVPRSHPRYLSLKTRDDIVAGVKKGITSEHGLIAHGRGEAFDYLLGEVSQSFAQEATLAAAAMLLEAKHPVVSVNGNAAALAPAELVALGKAVNAPLEVNIFHASKAREQALRAHMLEFGAPEILMPTPDATLDFIESNRRFVHPEGIFKADVVFVPLEDGDRCQALERMGKKVITIDLNPTSRTSRAASVTIVDNIVRAAPNLLAAVNSLAEPNDGERTRILGEYDNGRVLAAAEACIRSK